MSQIIEVKVPDIGDFKDVAVIELYVKAGDRIAVDDPLVTLETAKAAMEVPSPNAGLVKSVSVKVGDKVSEGSTILVLEAEEVAVETKIEAVPEVKTAPEPVKVEAAPAKVEAAPATKVVASEPIRTSPGTHASPSVRKFARELGVDLSKVRASGPKGRILRDDIQSHVKGVMTSPVPQAAAPAPSVDFSKFGPVEEKPLSRIQKISGANLARNWASIPHVTQHDEVDITELEAFRKSMAEEYKKSGVRLTLPAFLIKACASAMAKYPAFNASLSGADTLVLKQYCNIGIAVDTPDGLVVPVIRDADKKSVLQIAAELGELSAKAREGKLSLAEMQGGCFSISSLGGIGGSFFTPIINAPEVAILGVSKSAMKPVFRDGGFVPRLMLPLSLSYDHRVIDGAMGAKFIVHLGMLLSDIRRLIL